MTLEIREKLRICFPCLVENPIPHQSRLKIKTLQRIIRNYYKIEIYAKCLEMCLWNRISCPRLMKLKSFMQRVGLSLVAVVMRLRV